MRLFLTALIISISFLCDAQENTLHSISIPWEDLSAPLLSYQEISNATKYQLQEVDLSINLREQYIRKNEPPMMYLPKNKFIQSNFHVALPQQGTQKTTGFRISGSNNFNSNQNYPGGTLKNTAYRDATLYNRTFYPRRRLFY